MKISFNNEINLKEIIEKNNYSLENYVSSAIGNDNKIYILLNERIPDRIDGMFVNTESNSNYSIIVLDVDWDNSEVINYTTYNIGTYKTNFHMIQPMENNILLVGARCYNNPESGPENNAIVIDYSGNIIKEFCLGDGINNCIVCKNGNIITSYFDEGIFGNYGWDEPIGSSGLVVWNKDGKIIWEADNDICDCYAMNIDENENIWYYYYTDFELIKTDMKTQKAFAPNIEGASGFLVTSDMKHVIFEGGYDNPYKFFIGELNEDKLGELEEIQLMNNEKNITVGSYILFKSKAVFIDDNVKMFLKKF